MFVIILSSPLRVKYNSYFCTVRNSYKTYTDLKETENIYNSTMRQIEDLYKVYCHFKTFYRKADKEKAVKLAETRYSNYMFNLSKSTNFVEFAKHHKSLENCMAENRKKRTGLTNLLKELKVELKELTKIHAESRASDLETVRNKQMELLFKVEEMLQMKGVEIQSASSHRYHRTESVLCVRIKISTEKHRLQFTKELNNWNVEDNGPEYKEEVELSVTKKDPRGYYQQSNITLSQAISTMSK